MGLILLLYGLLNIPAVQNYIKRIIVEELDKKLDTNFDISSLYIKPFNIIQLNDVYLNDKADSTILRANKIYAHIELLPLLSNQLIISTAKLSDFEVNLSKDSTQGKLNIQFILDAFKPKEKKTKTKLDVKINSINIANGNFRFDVKSYSPILDKFDPNHIAVSNLNAKLALKSLQTDSLNIQIKKLQLEERSGLKINNLIARFITYDHKLHIKGFNLTLPKSRLVFDKCEIDYANFLTPADFLNRGTFDTKITSSYIVLQDIAAFVPTFKHFDDRILFKSEIEGKIDSIQVKNITLDYGDQLHLSANGLIKDIGDKKKTFLQGKINNLNLSKDGVNGILNNFSAQKKATPKILQNLGAFSFQGSVYGYLHSLKANGQLISQLGAINANAVIGINPDPNHTLSFLGKVTTNNFNLGKLLDNKDFENISFDLTTKILSPNHGSVQAFAIGLVKDFTFKKYTYQNIKIDGEYNGKQINGKLSLDDPNAILNFDGLIDLSDDPKHDFHAQLKNVRLDNLNLTKKYKEAYLNLIVNAKFKGKNIDDLQGYIDIDSIRFWESGKMLKLNKLLVEASGLDKDRILSIESDIISGKVTGAYSFSTIAQSFKRSLHQYLPSLIDWKKTKVKENNLYFDFTIKNTKNISDVFKLPVTIFEPAKIIGFYNNLDEKFEIGATLPFLQVGNFKIHSGKLSLWNTDKAIEMNLDGSIETKNGTINHLLTNLNTANDHIQIKTLFKNREQEKLLKGEFINNITFSRNDKDELQTDLHFFPGELSLNNLIWKIKESNISITKKEVDVDHFSVNNLSNKQSLSINGTYSIEDEDKKLHIDLKKIDLDYIFKLLAINALQFGGAASGDLIVSSIKEKPYADISLNVEKFAFNQSPLGDLSLHSNLDNETLKVNLEGKITNENQKLTNIDGFINPLTQELSINFDAEDINVGFLNKYVETLFNNVKGRGSGNVHLFGNFSKVTVEGTAFIKDGSIGINFLNTNYSFTDTVFMKKDLIYFKDISFVDEKNNTAKVSGRVVHDFFSNFMYYVDLKGDNFLLYDATEKQNPMFYGTVFGSGKGVIKGDEKVLDINMNLRTERNTKVFMNFMEETATQYSFITYKTRESDADSTKADKPKYSFPKHIQTDSGMEMNMNFYVDATPDATIEFLMDPVGGDKLKGSGTGALQFTWGTSKDPMLYGTYQINKGSYNFTFQKLLERKFMIQDGSSVQFRGDPFLADLDITAVYRVTANLNDLDRNLVLSTGQTNVPVNCLLNLTGLLKQPNINLDVVLPSADPEVQRQVKALMGTEDMINRQIVYLLLLSKFYTPSYAVTDQRTSDFAAVASATLSSQLSKILSQIDDRWQIGTNIRTSDSEFTSTEVELILSSRLLNDRILFNGNFGYRDNLETPNSFIGDIDLEILLNRLGTWRLKAYNHYNEKYYYVRNGGSVQTQGLGIMYKKDFDDIRELFSRPTRKKKNKEKQDSLSTNDSIKIQPLK